MIGTLPRPTGSGFLFALLVAAMLTGSINYQNNLGFLLTFLLAATAALSLLHNWRNSNGMRLQTHGGAAVFAGETARFVLTIDDPAARPRRALRLCWGEGERQLDLDADQQHRIELETPAPNRGELTLGPVTLDSRYPLGLSSCRQTTPGDVVTLVYPRPLALPARHGEAESGRQHSSDDGSDDFRGFRHYQRGDPLQRLNWRAIARGLPPLTRQHERPAQQDEALWLDWDRLPVGDTELRLSWLCRQVLDAEVGERPYGLRLPGKEIAADHGTTHRHRCLRALAYFK